MPLRHLVSLIAPPRCGVCGAPCEVSATVCGGCETRLARLTPRAAFVPGIDAVWSAGAYEGVARELVAALKFSGRLALARTAAAAIVAPVPPGLLAGVLVPVPPSPSRRRRRGFDPAEAIAAAVARRAGLPVSRCLRRSDGPRQVGRSRVERLAQPPLVGPGDLVPRRVVLIDDVLTTGATLAACAAALRGAGAERVVALTFARSGR